MMAATNLAFALTGVLTILYLLYRWALPKPLPGIPYNEEATKKVLGDLPNLIDALKNGSDLGKWLREQNRKANSHISQIFLRPFEKPIVLIADHREARDMMVNRTQDFDRSVQVRQLFLPLLGRAQITLPTGSVWKHTRRISQDTMSPKFLREAVAPTIHQGCRRFIELWNMKAEMAQGHAFDAETDIYNTALDSVLAFTYGESYPYSGTETQIESLRGVFRQNSKTLAGTDASVEFPHVDIAEELTGMSRLCAAVEEVQSTGVPYWAWMYKKRTSSFKNLVKIKDQGIRREISKAVARFEQFESGDTQDSERTAVDFMIRREAAMAAKEDRAPNFYSDRIQDEILGFIIGGHDTTSATMGWACKLFADNQDKQTLLRQALQKGYDVAKEENRMPTANEILTTPVPYLEATIEEILRVAPVVPVNSREAIRDTEMFGHMIPKGTSVYYLTIGPSVVEPTYKISEDLRSESSQRDHKIGKTHDWDEDDDMSAFQPERWLAQQAASDAKEETTRFDPNAGPMLGFGLGVRGCFGRRLAYVVLRTLVVSIIWNFELLECPKELSSYDAVLGVVYKPKKAYVRLRKVDLTRA